MSSKRRGRIAFAAGLGLLAGLALLWWKRDDTNPRHVSRGVVNDAAEVAATSSQPPSAPLVSPQPGPKPKATQALGTPPDATAAVRFQRGEHEWQGMLPESNDVWLCPENAAGCGMARACVQGMCTPCVADNECLGSELCVLGTCMLEELVGCQSAADCASDQVCMLSGFTPLDARNNRDLKSKCVRDHWNEDANDDPAAQRERRRKDQADLAYQNSTTKQGPPAAYSVTPSGELATKALRSVLSSKRGTTETPLVE